MATLQDFEPVSRSEPDFSRNPNPRIEYNP